MSQMVVMSFGEILWDRLPDGDHLGGAPFNVAYHLGKLGCKAVFVSAVGEDDLGVRALRQAELLGVDTSHVQRLPHLPTGLVLVNLTPSGNAHYVIAEPAAWDEIACTDALSKAARSCHALVFGSLAMRSEANRAALATLRQTFKGLQALDVNLRPPYDNPALVLMLAKGVDALKLNEEEVRHLTPTLPPHTPLAEAAEALRKETGAACICVTRGAKGAAFMDDQGWIEVEAPPVHVADTVGAGDAFMAAFVSSLVAGKASSKSSLWLLDACKLGAYVASRHGATPEYSFEEVLKMSEQ